MIIYSTVEIPEMRLDYIKLAEKMWFKEYNGKALDIAHFGNTEMLQLTFSVTLNLPKWEFDKRWSKEQLSSESLEVAPTSLKHFKELEFITQHVDILTVDKRAFYIFVLEVTKEVQGKISVDNRQTWLTTEQFAYKFRDIFSLNYVEANELSLKEASNINLIEERDPNILAENDYLESFWDSLEENGLKMSVKPKKIGMKIDYLDLAKKMWSIDELSKLDVINYDQDILEEDFYLALKIKNEFETINPTYKIPKYFVLSLESKEEKNVDFYTTFTDIKFVDKRAMLIMAIEIAKLTNGDIRCNEEQTWQTVTEFKKKHRDILAMTYKEATRLD